MNTRGIGLLFVVTLLAAAAAAAASASASATTEPPAPEINQAHVLQERSIRLTGSGSNVVRSGPGNSFAIFAVYPEGAEFVVIAKKADWYNVRLSETNTGWIHSSLCEEFDDMSDLEYRPNPRLFSRAGAFSLTAYAGGYAFDRKSNSLVFGGRFGYYLLDYIGVEGNIGWTSINRPAEIVETLFGLSLEEEEFDMLFYAFNVNFKLLPGRQMVPYVTVGLGSSIMEGLTETGINYGAGVGFFVGRQTSVNFEFRSYAMSSGTENARRDNTNYEFSVGTTYLF